MLYTYVKPRALRSMGRNAHCDLDQFDIHDIRLEIWPSHCHIRQSMVRLTFVVPDYGASTYHDAYEYTRYIHCPSASLLESSQFSLQPFQLFNSSGNLVINFLCLW